MAYLARFFIKWTALLFFFALFNITLATAQAQKAPSGLLLPIGGGYTDTYNGFAKQAITRAHNNIVKILVLPVPYATNAEQISAAERNQNLKDAEERRKQVEGACQRNAPPSLACEVLLVPLFTRTDAADPTVLAQLSNDVAAVYILGGDQAIAMQAIANTPAEARLAELYEQGTIIAGTSAGGGMQSKTMLAAYQTNYGPESSLFWGAIDIWNGSEKRGLIFGLEEAVIDQHFYQRARMGRLINAITRPDVVHLGIGIDAYTGVVVEGNRLRDVFGLYTITVLDAETYHAADAVRYVSLSENRPPLLSTRNILVNLLSPGEFSYDLKTRTGQAGNQSYPALQRLERSFESLTPPQGAGTLILAGDLSNTLEGNSILKRFVELAGGKNAILLVIADGGASATANERTAQRYADALAKLGAKATVGNAEANLETVTGLVLVGRDASKMTPPEWLRAPWLAGKPILADNAAATLLGSFYAAHPPTPAGDSEQEEIAVQRSFLQGKTEIKPGINLLSITLQPQLLDDKRFGRLFALAYNHPTLPAIGLNANTALEISSEGARVLGENGIFVLDLRFAERMLGSNNGFVIFNGLLDVFAPGELLQPEIADVNAVYQPQPTPVLPSFAPNPTFTASTPLTITPSHTPAPTFTAALATPLAAPAPLVSPPASRMPPFWGIGLGLLLILGAWLWSKFKKRP